MKDRSKYALAGLALLVLAALVLLTPVLRNTREVAWLAWTNTIGGVFRVGPLTVSNNVEQQLARLQSENVRLRAELLDYQRLREQLGTPAFEGFESVATEVAGRPLDAWRSQFMLSKGARDGVVLGAPAVINGSTVVGFVVDLSDHTAVLQLMFHPSLSIAGEAIGEDEAGRGLVQGKSFSSVEINTVPRDVELKSGQAVVTTVQQNLVPEGLLIGSIATINDTPQQPYQTARLNIPYDPDRIYAVSILVSRE